MDSQARLRQKFTVDEEFVKDMIAKMDFCWPGIVKSFNSAKQTVTVQIAIKRLNGKSVSLVVDAPIQLPTCQGFHLTLPIKKDDECLLVVAGRCIDNWFTKGGVQEQAEFRIQDKSDGFALIGVNSEPNVITGYNANDLELRNSAGDQYVRLKANKDIEIKTPTIFKVDCATMTLNGTTAINSTTPTWTQTGNLTVTGALAAATGAFTSSLVVASKELAGHTHPAGTPPGNTGTNN